MVRSYIGNVVHRKVLRVRVTSSPPKKAPASAGAFFRRTGIEEDTGAGKGESRGAFGAAGPTEGLAERGEKLHYPSHVLSASRLSLHAPARRSAERKTGALFGGTVLGGSRQASGLWILRLRRKKAPGSLRGRGSAEPFYFSGPPMTSNENSHICSSILTTCC